MQKESSSVIKVQILGPSKAELCGFHKPIGLLGQTLASTFVSDSNFNNLNLG